MDLRQVPSEGLGVTEQEAVHQTEELHHALVLTEILVTLQEELVFLSIAPYEGGMQL